MASCVGEVTRLKPLLALPHLSSLLGFDFLFFKMKAYLLASLTKEKTGYWQRCL